MYPLAPKLPPAHGHTGGCNIGRFPAHASKPVVRTAGVEPALGQLTEARNREKPNLLPCANIRIDCRFFRLSGCVGNPAPVLSHIGLRGVAVPSCHILSFLNTSGFHGWVRPSIAPFSSKEGRGIPSPRCLVCPIVKRRSLPLCHRAPLSGPRLRWFFLIRFFLPKNPCRKP